MDQGQEQLTTYRNAVTSAFGVMGTTLPDHHIAITGSNLDGTFELEYVPPLGNDTLKNVATVALEAAGVEDCNFNDAGDKMTGQQGSTAFLMDALKGAYRALRETGNW